MADDNHGGVGDGVSLEGLFKLSAVFVILGSGYVLFEQISNYSDTGEYSYSLHQTWVMLIQLFSGIGMLLKRKSAVFLFGFISSYTFIFNQVLFGTAKTGPLLFAVFVLFLSQRYWQELKIE